jgi:hypothetical protein
MRLAVILSLLLALPLDARTRAAVRYCAHTNQEAIRFNVIAFPDGSTYIDSAWVCEKDRTFIGSFIYVNCLDDLLPCMARDLVDANQKFRAGDVESDLDVFLSPLPLVVGSSN